MAELIAALSEDKPNYGMDDLRKIANDCPACILAGIRQSSIRNGMSTEKFWEWMAGLNFDFKAELAKFWEMQNDAKYQAGM